jgi:menaquinone-dependent protoporphyrinogen oxidase
VLVLYASREGQTKLVAEHVAANLRERGFEADVRDARTRAPRALDRYAGAILAGSVHMQRHEAELEAFVRKNRDELEHMPTAFLSVSLTEAGAEDPTLPQEERDRAMAEVGGLLRGFFDRTGWHPDRVRPVAGALAYSKYAAPTRLAMKLVAKLNHADTDTSKDRSYTDWQAIDRFVEAFCEARAI